MRTLIVFLVLAGVAAAQSVAVAPSKAEPVRVHRNHIAAFTAAIDGTDVQITGSPGLVVWRSQTTDPKVADIRAKASLPGCYSVTVTSTKDGKLASKTFAVHVVAWPYRILVSNREISP